LTALLGEADIPEEDSGSAQPLMHLAKPLPSHKATVFTPEFRYAELFPGRKWAAWKNKTIEASETLSWLKPLVPVN